MSEQNQPWIVVGLGNPGVEYQDHRHNIGAMVVEAIAYDCSAKLKRHSSRCQAAQVRWPQQGAVPGRPVVLAQPMSYMNLSGGPVSALLKFYSCTPERLIVVHDELDIPFADIKLKCGGGEGGHNGLRSISASTGTKDYYRVRVGVGRPPGRMEAARFVLRAFSASERKELPLLIDSAVEAVSTLITQGLTAAQQEFHTPR